MQCVILAGGLGTRMRSVTNGMAKAVLPVAGRPFIHHQIDWLSRHGIDQVVLCVGYRGDQLRDSVGDGRRWGVAVTYVDEGEELRGTAGALRLAADQGCLAERFLVVYGDSFLPIDFGAIGEQFRRCERPALMTVFRNQGQWDTSNVIFDGQRVVLYDKRHRTRPAADFDYIDYGLSALQASVVQQRIPADGPADLADLFFALSREGLLAGLEVDQRFYEVGSPSGLRDFEAWLASRGQAPCGLIVLDRDGVLNQLVPRPAEGILDSPLVPEEVSIFPWVPELLARLHQAGWVLAVATNQPAWAKGKATRENLEAVHRKVLAEAQSQGGVIASSHVCFHRAEDNCSCRKPQPGLLQDIFRLNPGLSPGTAWMVGDRPTDVLAGVAMGTRTALLGPQAEAESRKLAARDIICNFIGADLRDFAERILGSHSGPRPEEGRIR